jgi:hypothetical protein
MTAVAANVRDLKKRIIRRQSIATEPVRLTKGRRRTPYYGRKNVKLKIGQWFIAGAVRLSGHTSHVVRIERLRSIRGLPRIS